MKGSRLAAGLSRFSVERVSDPVAATKRRRRVAQLSRASRGLGRPARRRALPGTTNRAPLLLEQRVRSDACPRGAGSWPWARPERCAVRIKVALEHRKTPRVQNHLGARPERFELPIFGSVELRRPGAARSYLPRSRWRATARGEKADDLLRWPFRRRNGRKVRENPDARLVAGRREVPAN
jgi:hypothetical protein